MPELNPMQRAVVEHVPGDGALLVTAAAGSGKTAVVVERVISLITRETNPVDISRLLIITFTKAAAEEMRTRITLATRRALEKDPGNRNLARQYKLMHTAEISTIDSFYLRIVRENFHVLGISPDARIADEEESAGIRRDVTDALLEERYAAGDPAFLALSDMLSHGRNDDILSELIERIYRTFRSMPLPDEKLEAAAASFSAHRGDIAETVWGSLLLGDAREKLQTEKKRMEAALDCIAEDEKLTKAYAPAYAEDVRQLEKLLACAHGWDTLGKALSEITFSKLGALRNFGDAALQERLKAVREQYKKTVGELQECFSEGSESIGKDLERLAPAAGALAALVKDFSVRYLAAKTKKRILEYDDVSQYAYALLWRRAPDGSMVRTAEAERIADRYDEVIVDEYQDTNRLQDDIFHAITRGGRNLLMVGDVKQSIYGFRNAEPEAFVEKLAGYRPLAEAKSGLPRKQSLNLNYRSSGGVIDYTNFVFSRLMKKETGGIAYDDEQKLFLGRTDGARFASEMYFLSAGTSESTARAAEAKEIARYIKKTVEDGVMLPERDGGARRITYGDFAILLRSANDRYAFYEKALRDAGIPVAPPRAPALYSLPEGEFVLALLSTVDNPANDIMLLTVLTSPVYGFSPDELAAIRTEDKKAAFIEALRKHAAAGDEKCRDFLRHLSRWRSRRSEIGLGMLVREIYDDISLPALLMADGEGEERVENIYLIASLAEKYDNRGGLSAYLRGTARAVESGNQPEGASRAAGESAVQIMTIHHSKGLQFPFVILADTASRFNTRSLAESVIFHKSMGFGFKIHDTERGIRYQTLSHRAVKLLSEKTQCEEELRILYVALTRAMEKLVIFVTSADAESYIRKVATQLDENRITTTYRSYGEWLTAAALLSEEGAALRRTAGLETIKAGEKSGAVYTLSGVDNRETEDIPAADPKETAVILPVEIPEGLLDAYPCQYAVSLPTRLTATEVKETVRNPELFEESGKRYQTRREKRPAYLTERGLSASERGNAIHLALRLIDLKKTHSREDIRAEISRMAKKRWITAEEAEAIDPGRLAVFFASELGKRLCTSPAVKRELKFTLLDDAGKYDPALKGKGEKILLQGIIDCAFREDDAWVLIDYKSDRLKAGEDMARHTLERGYRKQLEVYAEALSRMTELPVREGWVFYTSRGAAVSIL